MNKVLALLLAGGRVDELSILTLSRPKSALPFGGMFRVIDFPLSNLMHSGVEKVGILSQYRSFSLINHIGIGAWWDFVGRDRGATMLMPSPNHLASEWYRGTANAVYQNLEFVREQDPEYVLILSGDHIYKMNYTEIYRYHREKDADLTVAFLPIKPGEGDRFGTADIDDEDGNLGGRIKEYQEKSNDKAHKWASLTIYLFKPQVLYEVLAANAMAASHEFGRDIIPLMLGKNYKVYGYKFNCYWAYTRTIDEYWRANMDLLGPQPMIDLEHWQVRTNLDHDRLRDRPPAQIASTGVVENSLIHNGCKVAGEVRNSILFPGVSVAKNAKVENSILFFDSVVESGASVLKTLSDNEVFFGKECEIGKGEEVPNQNAPDILSSGITLIGRGTKIPEKQVIGKNCIISPGLRQSDFVERKIDSGKDL